MKLMMQKWCWIGLILCASGTAWAAADDDEEKSASDTKKSSTDKADSKDDSAKDDAADEDEDVAPKTPPKKAAAKEKASASSTSHSALNLGALVGYGASPFTRLGIGLRGGLTMGGKEGPYVGIIGTLFTGTSVSQPRINMNNNQPAEKTRKAVILGVEGGYDTYASTDFLVRPYMSIGMAFVGDHTCATGTCTDDNGVRLTIAPGAQAVYMMGAFYLGGDIRYQIILNKSDASAAVLSLVLGLSL